MVARRFVCNVTGGLLFEPLPLRGRTVGNKPLPRLFSSLLLFTLTGSGDDDESATKPLSTIGSRRVRRRADDDDEEEDEADEDAARPRRFCAENVSLLSAETERSEMVTGKGERG